jgi:hypothetical protein
MGNERNDMFAETDMFNAWHTYVGETVLDFLFKLQEQSTTAKSRNKQWRFTATARN